MVVENVSVDATKTEKDKNEIQVVLGKDGTEEIKFRNSFPETWQRNIKKSNSGNSYQGITKRGKTKRADSFKEMVLRAGSEKMENEVLEEGDIADDDDNDGMVVLKTLPTDDMELSQDIVNEKNDDEEEEPVASYDRDAEKNVENGPDMFTKGLEYYLMHDGKKISRARYEPIDGGDTVHFKEMHDDEGRFFISKVMKNTSMYHDFDADRHCVGSAVIWKKNLCCSLKRATLSKSGTEAIEPIVADTSPEKKRKPESWKRNIKRSRTNAGKSYEGTVKRGKKKERVIIKEKVMRAGCEGKCLMSCKEIYPDEERKIIFDQFQQLPTIEEKRHFILQSAKNTKIDDKKKKVRSNDNK